MFDNLYAAELSVAGSVLSLAHGDAVQRTHSAVGEAVFGCYDKGRKRIKSEVTLQNLSSYVSRLSSSRATADLWAGIAFSLICPCESGYVCSLGQIVFSANAPRVAKRRLHWLANLRRLEPLRHGAARELRNALFRHNLISFVRLVGGGYCSTITG